MTQEQLMKVKIKYLEDRLTTMEKSLSRINNILVEVRFKMRDNKGNDSGFKDLEDIKDHVSKVNIIDDHELI